MNAHWNATTCLIYSLWPYNLTLMLIPDCFQLQLNIKSYQLHYNKLTKSIMPVNEACNNLLTIFKRRAKNLHENISRTINDGSKDEDSTWLLNFHRQIHTVLFKKRQHVLWSWTKANLMAALQQKPYHNCYEKVYKKYSDKLPSSLWKSWLSRWPCLGETGSAVRARVVCTAPVRVPGCCTQVRLDTTKPQQMISVIISSYHSEHVLYIATVGDLSKIWLCCVWLIQWCTDSFLSVVVILVLVIVVVVTVAVVIRWFAIAP